MVGRDLLPEGEIAAPTDSASLALEAARLEAEGLGPLDLAVSPGEVVGVAGLMGSGRSRLLNVVMGARPMTHGQMRLAGSSYRPHSPRMVLLRGLAMCLRIARRRGCWSMRRFGGM